jgi:hypothetical protein
MSQPWKAARACILLLQSSQPGHIIARLFVMGGTNAQLSVGKVSLPGHFDLPVALVSSRPIGKRFECRVRLHDGSRPASSHYP